MIHLKKISILLVISLITVGLLGCSDVKKTEKKIEKKSEVEMTQSLGGFEITLDKLENYPDRDPVEKKAPEHVSSIDVTIKNTSTVEQGIGSLDFVALDKKGEELTRYGYADSLGDVVPIDGVLEDKLYFIGDVKEIAEIKYINENADGELIWSYNK